jgi:hypothetical protein
MYLCDWRQCSQKGDGICCSKPSQNGYYKIYWFGSFQSSSQKKILLEMDFVSELTSGGRVEIVPRGYLQISFLQPSIRDCQRSKGISRSKILVVIVWVVEYFEINEMNFVFLILFIGEWLVIRDYRSWVVIMVLVTVFGLFVITSQLVMTFVIDNYGSDSCSW